MNTEAKELRAFLTALADNPRDVDLRRVFADWLDEHDAPELADEQRKFCLDDYDAARADERDAIGRDWAELNGWTPPEYERCAC